MQIFEAQHCQLMVATGFVQISFRHLQKQKQTQTQLRLSCTVDRRNDTTLAPIVAILNTDFLAFSRLFSLQQPAHIMSISNLPHCILKSPYGLPFPIK